MSLLWLITARGGSKGVPGKNLRKIGGLSLVGWKAKAAREAGAKNIAISTDDSAIQLDATEHGINVPFTRPPELATDEATSAAVVRHAIDAIKDEDGNTFDAVMLLEPSSPFIASSHYGMAQALMAGKDADLVVGMKMVEPHSTFIGEVQPDNGIGPIVQKVRARGDKIRRQDFQQEWTMCGGIYIFRTDMFMRTGSIYGGDRSYGVTIDKWRAIEIDTMADLAMAEYAYEKGLVGKA